MLSAILAVCVGLIIGRTAPRLRSGSNNMIAGLIDGGIILAGLASSVLLGAGVAVVVSASTSGVGNFVSNAGVVVGGAVFGLVGAVLGLVWYRLRR
jgi:hypothetical protein